MTRRVMRRVTMRVTRRLTRRVKRRLTRRKEDLARAFGNSKYFQEVCRHSIVGGRDRVSGIKHVPQGSVLYIRYLMILTN